MGILICARYRDCGGGKCLGALREVGTHPIPLKYRLAHDQLPFWEQANMKAIAGHLLAETREVMESYN